jgi:hypothetical protein
MEPKALIAGEVLRVTNRWIRVPVGYLGNFSYATHEGFYVEYCALDGIDPRALQGTTRERLITILADAPPDDQARILQGVLGKYPSGLNAPARISCRSLGKTKGLDPQSD